MKRQFLSNAKNEYNVDTNNDKKNDVIFKSKCGSIGSQDKSFKFEQWTAS